MASELDGLSSRFEIQRLLELLNSDQQEPDQQSPDIDSQPLQRLVGPDTRNENSVLDVVGAENRFVAHISHAMSKTRSDSFDSL
jgi:hypothetical protein